MRLSARLRQHGALLRVPEAGPAVPPASSPSCARVAVPVSAPVSASGSGLGPVADRLARALGLPAAACADRKSVV